LWGDYGKPEGLLSFFSSLIWGKKLREEIQVRKIRKIREQMRESCREKMIK